MWDFVSDKNPHDGKHKKAHVLSLQGVWSVSLLVDLLSKWLSTKNTTSKITREMVNHMIRHLSLAFGNMCI